MENSVKSQEKKFRNIILQKTSKGFIQNLRFPNSIRTLITFAHIWLILAICLISIVYTYKTYDIYTVFYLLPLTILIASRQNALSVQIHESAHYLLFRSKLLNDVFCNLFGAYWVLNDVVSYRVTHLEHHQHLHSENDPDRDLYSINNKSNSKPAPFLYIINDIFGITAMKRIFQYTKINRPDSTINNKFTFLKHFVGKLFAQFIIFLFFYLFSNFSSALLLWFVFWIIPLFCIFPIIIRIRTVAEHFSEYDTQKVNFTARTSQGNIITNYLLGACMEFHFEHHLLPYIPHYNLKKVHKELKKEGLFVRNKTNQFVSEDFLSGGYLNFWFKLVKTAYFQNSK